MYLDLQEYSSLFFTEDSCKTVDFVLVWDSRNAISATDSAEQRRVVFERNLLDEGLELETEGADTGSALTFIKIHAPLEVLRRYSEILKLRMPMKEVRIDDCVCSKVMVCEVVRKNCHLIRRKGLKCQK